jgi:membrane complex biogenesis BtpA family protein
MKRALTPRALLAMIAVRALPGSPLYDGDDSAVIDWALKDLAEYIKAGVDAVVLENDYDIPFIKPPLPEKGLALMRSVAVEVRKRFEGPIGLQLLEGANESAMEIAASADLDFIRVEGFVYAHVGGAGIIEGCAGKLLRRRMELGVPHIKIFADVKKKHCAHALTGDLTIVDEVKQSEFFMVDGVVVTGPRTGEEPQISDLEAVRAATTLPIFIGSGMTPENSERFMGLADGFIVGSTFRKDGRFLADLDPARLERFVGNFRRLRASV